ncbi:MAG: His/Glu/Gln/Arg/opine amino acid ABC transporter permease/periplasmic amino acid-binding protein [Deltaproteobacteria bacterium CSP1-8]|nr:MAG: His/Glu/Gln/Arg/opine amino acid ABC transporter permease/periplasmic amino acid-binding protein [Deltaproteobacteria bacterium CSP1-8]
MIGSRGTGPAYLKYLLILPVIFLLLFLSSSSRSGSDAAAKVRERGTLLWGGDAEGGAPYVFPDPKNVDVLIGFEVELAGAIAKVMGVPARFVQNAWDSLIPALERGDFDLVINGIEITPERTAKVLFSRPYYVYTEQLVVRREEDGIRGLADLAGKRVGTLMGAVSQTMLQQAGGVDIRIYSGVVEPYEDLALGRLDAVFLDLPIAAYYARPNPLLKYAGPPAGEGYYGIAIRREDASLKEAVDGAIDRLLRSGELRRIYEKWGLWNEAQEKLFHPDRSPGAGASGRDARDAPLVTFFPALLKGAGITVLVSVVSMGLAVALGLLLCLLRHYSGGPLRIAASSYIEIFRGTPLLIQLYLLYYGLPNVGITLSPLLAAFLGLGMNYAAYEAELYRAGIEAIPKGQMEAALSLGMSRRLALRRIVLPQALRVAVPGVTNDFISLFKDSSLVSVIAMVELTKTYNILAATTLRFLELGLVAAFLYFAMSYPLSLMARRLEERLAGRTR